MTGRLRWPWVAGGGALLLLAVLQVLLPELAENRIEGELDEVGDVREVDVDAFPALKLLLGRADRVKVRIDRYDSQGERFADFIADADRVEELDAEARTLRVGPLRLRRASMRKEGGAIRTSAQVRDADLDRAFPFGFRVEPKVDRQGRLVLEGSIDVLGARARGEAEVTVRDGRIVVSPVVPLGRLLAFEVFGDERLRVESVGARDIPGGFEVRAYGRIIG